MKIYQAGPLFTEAEQKWHRKLKKKLENEGYDVIWPYELFDQKEILNMGEGAQHVIMKGCRDALDKCDIVVALLDGPQVDDGTAWELGYAWAKKIPAIGIRTDYRAAGDTANGKANAMIAGSCETILATRDELIEYVKTHYPHNHHAQHHASQGTHPPHKKQECEK